MLNADTILKALQDARKKNQLYMVYQPIFDLHSQCICGFEALMRWNNPDKGMVAPDLFISLLEKSGHFIAIEDMVTQTPWETAVLWPKNISLSINYSALELCEPGLFERVKRNFATFCFDPHRCEIEITETQPMFDSEAALKNIVGLKAQGIKITLDDFGTGHANLDYLLKYPVDTIKVDKTFIAEMNQCSKSEKIFEGIITLAHSLGISVLAEGVENKAQIDLLRSIGCDKVQGFYISQPVLPEEISRLLTRYV
ncbi:TPA: EAL domain-containing protein [Citrobacter braakii]